MFSQIIARIALGEFLADVRFDLRAAGALSFRLIEGGRLSQR